MNDVSDVALRLAIVFVVFLVAPLLVGQTEHKVMAHMQGRLGPMYAGGFHGWAQLVADGVKFAQKEDVVPAAADRRVFQLAPAVALLPYLLVLVAIPVGPGDGAVGQVIDAGIFFVLAVMGIGVLGSLMAGWASANKFSLLGGLRTAAQLLSYELPMLLAAASVAMAAGTVSLTGILDAFEWWWLPWQIAGALVFFVAGLAELQRPPFEMPVADSEIIFGAYTEYTRLRSRPVPPRRLRESPPRPTTPKQQASTTTQRPPRDHDDPRRPRPAPPRSSVPSPDSRSAAPPQASSAPWRSCRRSPQPSSP
ncbi:NAD(P)H-quinone oxidoreductase subunit 1, chloroplastic [Streptomyces microflavus]